MIKANRDVACDFYMLSLVVTDGHFVGVVEQNIGGLQRWVGEQTG